MARGERHQGLRPHRTSAAPDRTCDPKERGERGTALEAAPHVKAAERMGEMGKVLWHTVMSLDELIAGQDDDMDWVFGIDGGSGETAAAWKANGASGKAPF